MGDRPLSFYGDSTHSDAKSAPGYLFLCKSGRQGVIKGLGLKLNQFSHEFTREAAISAEICSS